MMNVMKFHFLATLDGNDINLVAATVFRVGSVGVVPFEIIAGLDNRRNIEVERLIVVGCWVDVFTVAAFVRPPMPDIVRRANNNFDDALTGRSVLFDRVTFNRGVIAAESTFLEGILPIHPRLARRFTVDIGARALV